MESESEGSDPMDDGSDAGSEEGSGGDYGDSSDDEEVERYSGRGTDLHEAAFGSHTNISVRLRNLIDMVRDNHPEVDSCRLDPGWHYSDLEGRNDISVFGKSALEMLGKYIANNTHVWEFSIKITLADWKAAALFRGLTKSDTIRDIYLSGCGIGINFIRSMVPFLRNCPSIQSISLNQEQNFDDECLELLADSLGGDRVKSLSLFDNNIRNVRSLEKFTQLVDLSLGGNNIGYEGSEIISTLVRNDNCVIEELDLHSTGIGPEGVEEIITMLEGNTSMHYLRLEGNEISESGSKAFLKIMNDISSIESTLNSNCTLRGLRCPVPPSGCTNRKEISDILHEVESAVYMNHDDWKSEGMPKGTEWQNKPGRQIGRRKVIQTQLASFRRKRLCKYQGIEYSHGSIFAGINAVVLPNLIALIGKRHGQTDLYRMLLSISSNLICLIDREKMLKDSMKKVKSEFKKISWEYSNITFGFTHQSSALAAKFFNLSERLVAMKAIGNSPQAKNWEESMEDHTRQKRTMEENIKQLESGAREFSYKHAELSGQIDSMMSNLTQEFPLLNVQKRKRSLSV